MMRPRPPRGSVLALAVLVLVALQLLAHGALLMARGEWASSVAGQRLLQARACADAGALEVERASSEAWDSVALFETAPPVTGSLSGHPFLGRTQRLSREYWLVEGQGRSRGERWGVTVRYLVWRLDPLGRVAAAHGAAEVGGALPDAGAVATDSELPAYCHSWQAALDSLVAPDVWSRAVRAPPAAGGEPSLGRLTPGDLSAALPAFADTSGTPAPVTRLGRCDASQPWNWGDPLRPAAPCGGRLVAWAVPGALHLGPGAGQGLLAVRGDLDLAGTRFDGVLLVGGSLTLRDGAEVRGMLRVGGDLGVAAGSRIVGSPCRALRVLESLRGAFGRPVRVAEAGLFEGGW